MTKRGINQIIRTLLIQINTQWASHLSQELQDIDFQLDTKDFQSHGNKCAKDGSHPLEMAFSLSDF